MILNVFVGEQAIQIDVPESMISEAMSLFAMMDKDMDSGWQMSRTWVDDLTDIQRCQVVADKLLTALENDNDNMKMMMAAYILYKMPNVKNVYIDTEGDMMATELQI